MTAAVTPGALRRPALLWALLHAPIVLVLYEPTIARTIAAVPGPFAAGLLIALTAEAVVLACLPFALALPFGVRPQVYRYAAPLASALAIVFFAVDSRLYRALEMHVNAFFLRALMQPGSLGEIGLSQAEVALFAAAALVWVALAVWAGSRFLGRFPGQLRIGRVLLLVLALQLADRIFVASMEFVAGPAIFAASQLLPLQVPLRMNRFLTRLTGRPKYAAAGALGAALRADASRLHGGMDPASVRFTQRPDIVLAIVESLRADFLDSATMPNLWRRAGRGALFTRHYAGASSTHYTLFSLFFGLQAHKLDAVVGSGRAPLVFGALRANGYRMRLLAASSVDWMGLKETVFGDVRDDLETRFPGTGSARDSAMLASADRFTARADTAPLFLMLFFDGTHFNYTFPPGQTPFRPYWDGVGSIDAARVAPALIQNRARNAAYEVDRVLASFLERLTAARGREPVVIVTGDHGEEFREHGRIGHGTDVSEEQVHVPMVVSGPGVPAGPRESVTSHMDVVPTLFALLGDRHPPAGYADGISMFDAPADRFVLTTVGWLPRYAVIGRDLKVRFFGLDAGLGEVAVTDPLDRPLPDGDALLAAASPRILRAFLPAARQH